MKFALLDCAARQRDHILNLHAGAVVSQGRLIVLPTASGNGKPSLTAGLMAAGCEYFTGEVVLLENQAQLMIAIWVKFYPTWIGDKICCYEPASFKNDRRFQCSTWNIEKLSGKKEFG